MTISCDGETINYKQKSLLSGNTVSTKTAPSSDFFLGTVGPSTAKHGSAKKRKNPGLSQQTLQCIFRRCPCHRWKVSSHLENTIQRTHRTQESWRKRLHLSCNIIKQTVEQTTLKWCNQAHRKLDKQNLQWEMSKAACVDQLDIHILHEFGIQLLSAKTLPTSFTTSCQSRKPPKL